MMKKPDNLPAKGWAICRRDAAGLLDKSPRDPRNGRRISTAAAVGWTPLEVAIQALKPGDTLSMRLNGRTEPLCVIDLDGHRDPETGKLTDWASELVAKCATFTEISQSGKGLHIIGWGKPPEEILPGQTTGVKIELYDGTSARHIAFTGNHLPGTPEQLQDIPPDVLATLVAEHKKAKEATSEATSASAVQAFAHLDGEALLANLVSEHRLAASVAKELTEGMEGDKSERLQHLTKVLRKAGATDEECMAILTACQASMGVALDHRRDDYDGACTWLWNHQIKPAWADESAAPPEFPVVTEADIQAIEAMEAAQKAKTSKPTGPDPVPMDWLAMPAHPPETVFLIPDWLPAGVVTLLAAHGGTGKSFMSIWIGICLAIGRDPLTGKPIPARKVLIYSAEDDTAVTQLRAARYMRMFNITPAQLSGRLLVLDATGSDNVMFAQGKNGEGLVTKRYDWLRGEVALFGADLLILDNASDAYSGNENDRAMVRQFMGSLRKAAPSVLLLSHVDAATSQADPREAKGYSGSTAWNNSARNRWFMARDPNKQDEVLLRLVKSNYGPTGLEATIQWDTLHKVFTVGSVRQGKPTGADHRSKLLALVAEAVERDVVVSPHARANNSVFNVLKDARGFPGLDSKAMATEVSEWLRLGLAEVVEYERSNRTTGTKLILTQAGLSVEEAESDDRQ